VAGPLLVSNEDVSDARIEQRVVDREDCAAGQAEHRLDPLLFQTLDERFGSGELHVDPLFFRYRKRPPYLGRPPVYVNA
jgi:hypothetical protein